jgi:hypothetical protein
MKKMCLVSAVVITSALFASAADRDPALRTFGDPSVRKAIDARAQALYQSASKPDAKRVFVITRDNPLALPAVVGTEATGVIVEGVVSRIVTNAWTKRGKYAVEFYQGSNGLFLVYETFTFFEDTAPRGAWRNFMGLPAWERRTYFNNDGNIGYAEARGEGAPRPGSDATHLRDQSARLTRLIEQQSARLERKE